MWSSAHLHWNTDNSMIKFKSFDIYWALSNLKTNENPTSECPVTYDDVALDLAAGSNPRVFTFDFDGKGSENGIYYVVDKSGVLSEDSISGVSLQLDGVSTNIEVPFFQNNEFSQFKFDGYFKRDSDGGEGQQGILFHGASPQFDCWPASVYVISTSSTSLRAGIVTSDGTFDIVSTAQVGLTNVIISRSFVSVFRSRSINCLPV